MTRNDATRAMEKAEMLRESIFGDSERMAFDLLG
jgi:hypothetical protein